MIDKSIDNTIIEYIPLSGFDVDNISQRKVINNNNLSMSTIKNVFQWLVYSSNNPQALSLTLKSLVAFAVLFGIDETVADSLSSGILQTIISVGATFSAVLMIFGAMRKVYSLKD